MRWIFVHFISYDPTQPDNIYSHVGAVNESRTFTTYFSEGEKPHPDIMISSLHKMPTFPILSLPVLTDGFTTKTGWICLGRKITLRTTAGKDRSSNVEIAAKAKRCQAALALQIKNGQNIQSERTMDRRFDIILWRPLV